jgi:cytochrome P450
LFAEVDATLSSGAPTVEQLQAMPLLEGVVKETLRLYPPAWLLARSVEGDDEVGGYRLRRGEHVFISPYLTHRHPEHWPEPDRFIPDRFSAGVRVPGGHRLAYLPFGSGPRICIGNAFAMLELKLVLAMIVQRFDFTSDEMGPPGLAPLIALRPRRAIRLRLQERRKSQN